jgi:hypothetical protein
LRKNQKFKYITLFYDVDPAWNAAPNLLKADA